MARRIGGMESLRVQNVDFGLSGVLLMLPDFLQGCKSPSDGVKATFKSIHWVILGTSSEEAPRRNV